MALKKNDIHPVDSTMSIESHVKNDIVIHTEDINGVDNAFAFFLAFLLFFCLLTVDGITHTTGLFTENFQARFNVTSLPLLLLPGSLMSGVSNIVAPLAGALLKKNLRVRCASGAILASIGAVSVIFVKNFYAFLVLFGIVMGVGIGLIIIPYIAICSKWFVKYQPLGIAFAYSGSGCGIFAFCQCIPYLPEHSRYEWHFIAIAILCFICSFSSIFYKKPEKYINKTLKDKIRELDQRYQYEEKIRLQNRIFGFSIQAKQRQDFTNDPFLDGKVLTTDNDLISVTTSTQALYDQPRLSKEQAEYITNLVMKRIQETNDQKSESETTDFKEMVRDYIQSKLTINTSSFVSLHNLNALNEEDKQIENLHKEIESVFKDQIDQQFSRQNDGFIDSVENIDFGRDLNNPQIPNDLNLSSGETESDEVESNNAFLLYLWKNPIFLFLMFSKIIDGLGVLTPFYFLPLYLSQNKINIEGITQVLSLMGIFDILGRITSIVYSEKLEGRIRRDDCLWFHNVGYLITSLSLVFVPFFINQFRIFTALCCLHSFTLVFSNSVKVVLVRNYLGDETLTSSYTYMMIVQGIFMILGAPLHGFLYELTNENYALVFQTIGGLFATSAFMCTFIKLIDTLKKPLISKEDRDVEKGDQILK